MAKTKEDCPVVGKFCASCNCFGNAPNWASHSFMLLTLVYLVMHFNGSFLIWEAGGKSLLSSFLDHLRLDRLASAGDLFKFLTMLGGYWYLPSCFPNLITRWWADHSGKSVKEWQAMSVVMLAAFTGVAAGGYGCYKFYHLVLICFTYGYIAGFHWSWKNKKKALFWIICTNFQFLMQWSHLLNVNTPITNEQHVYMKMIWLFGFCAYLSQTGSKAAAPSTPRGRSRSSSRKRK